MWLDVLCQLVGSTLIMAAALVVVFGPLWVAAAAFVLSIALFFLPYRLGSFVAVRKPHNAAS